MSDKGTDDGSELSDDDYNPDEDDSEKGSEIESDDDVDEEEQPVVVKLDKSKRSKGQKSKKSNKRRKPSEDDSEEEGTNEKTSEIDEEAEKKRTEALWADFLNDTGTSSTTVPTTTERPIASSPKTKKPKPTVELKPEKKDEPKATKTVTEIFEFAGEEVRVEKEVKVAKEKEESPSISRNRPSAGGGGLGAVLSALNKKNKLSTLEKSKLDWDGFKTKEGLSEEINTFNRGKDGFLEKQDFLERTDLKQFEIEKGLRQTRRSNR